MKITGYGKRKEYMEIEDARNETMFTARDSLSGDKLYEIISLNGEAEVFDCIMGLKRRVKASELYEWLTGLGI
jgi:hypothetical protein